jgi:hypothetical protein
MAAAQPQPPMQQSKIEPQGECLPKEVPQFKYTERYYDDVRY